MSFTLNNAIQGAVSSPDSVQLPRINTGDPQLAVRDTDASLRYLERIEEALNTGASEVLYEDIVKARHIVRALLKDLEERLAPINERIAPIDAAMEEVRQKLIDTKITLGDRFVALWVEGGGKAKKEKEKTRLGTLQSGLEDRKKPLVEEKRPLEENLQSLAARLKAMSARIDHIIAEQVRTHRTDIVRLEQDTSSRRERIQSAGARLCRKIRTALEEVSSAATYELLDATSDDQTLSILSTTATAGASSAVEEVNRELRAFIAVIQATVTPVSPINMGLEYADFAMDLGSPGGFDALSFLNYSSLIGKESELRDLEARVQQIMRESAVQLTKVQAVLSGMVTKVRSALRLDQ